MNGQSRSERASQLAVETVITPFFYKDGLPQWWERLFADCDKRSVFTSPAWMQSWIEVYGADFSGQWVRWESGEKVIAGCLLVSRSSWKFLFPITTLYLNASGETTRRTPAAEYNDVLCVPAFAEGVAPEFARLVRSLRWDQLHLSGYEKNGLADCVTSLLGGVVVDHVVCDSCFVDFSALGDELFEQSISANTRGQIRRSARLYEQQFGLLNLQTATTLEEAQQFLIGLAALHNDRRNAKGESGAFESAAVTKFHQQAIASLWPSAGVDLMRLSAGSKVIGYLYNFRIDGKVSFFQSGLVYEEDQKLKPGLLIHFMAIEYYRRGGQREYDFLAGASRYKRSLAKHSHQLCWSVVHRDNLKINAFLLVRRLVRALRQWRAKRLPHVTQPEPT